MRRFRHHTLAIVMIALGGLAPPSGAGRLFAQTETTTTATGGSGASGLSAVVSDSGQPDWPDGQIDVVLQQLRSPSFAERQAAAAFLQQIPTNQIEPLVVTAEHDASSEVIRRVFEFLESCYTLADEQRSRIAGELLEQSVASEHWMTSELAKQILQRNSRIRVTRSLQELQTLGATVRPRDPQEIWRGQFDAPIGLMGMGGPDDQIRIGVNQLWHGADRGMTLFQRLTPLLEDSMGVRGVRLGIYLIDGHPLTDPQVTTLKATFGDRRVVSRGKVCLGITNDPFFGDNIGCRVGTVSDGSSAGDAGLEQSDVILKLNGEDVKDFEHLVELLKQFEPGDKVTMTVRRPGSFPAFPDQPYRRNQVMDLPVTLKGWDDLE